jgi:hypothetical protein
MFKEIPFEARAHTFVKDKDKYVLWFNVALHMNKIITKDYDWAKPKILKLGIWIDETEGDSTLKSEMAIPIVLTPNILAKLRKAQFFGFNCGSDEVKLKKNRYKLVFALYDEAESNVGTVEQDLVIPDTSSLSESQVLTAVFGNLMQSSGKGNFKLDQKDGTLQLKGHKLYPMGSNMFRPRQDIALFLQVHAPSQTIPPEPEFVLFQMETEKTVLSSRMVNQSWDKKAKVWNCVYILDFQTVERGDYTLDIRLPNLTRESPSEKKIPLKII